MVNGEKPVPINQVYRFGMGDAILRTYQMVAGGPFDTSDHDRALQLRDGVLRGIVANNADVNFVKTHNTRERAFGYELIPQKYTRSAVYIIRNPLDMVLSYARHFGLDHEGAIKAISNDENTTDADKTNVYQYLGTWSQHVTSWTEKLTFPTLVLRYEDLQAKPEVAFASLLKHIGIPVDQARLEKAIRFSSFNELSKQESEGKFIEASPKSEKFFSRGTSGQWKNELDETLVQQVRETHGKVMKKYGYLDE